MTTECSSTSQEMNVDDFNPDFLVPSKKELVSGIMTTLAAIVLIIVIWFTFS